jgi:ETFB lysine methyltransferase
VAVRVRFQTLEMGTLDIHVRSLRSRNEFEDVDDAAKKLGISDEMWAVSCSIWDCGLALATLMVDYEIEGLRVLEVGCGIGVASLVLNQRNADITATDRHPEVGPNLSFNTDLNGDSEIEFLRTDWDDADCGLGVFDLIIGSDLLYESSHASALSKFIERHARETCQMLLVDPGRGYAGKMTRSMATLGYSHEVTSIAVGAEHPDRNVRLHAYRREAAPLLAS